MDGASSLGFSLINRPAAGCCVFSTSLLGQDDVHGTKGLGMAGRQACVLPQRTYTIGCTKSTWPRYNGPCIHPSHEPCNDAWCAAQYTCCTDLHVPSCRRPTTTGLRAYTVYEVVSLALCCSLHYLLLLWVRRAAPSHACADRSHLHETKDERTVVI
jgi:hypothetical protein